MKPSTHIIIPVLSLAIFASVSTLGWLTTHKALADANTRLEQSVPVDVYLIQAAELQNQRELLAHYKQDCPELLEACNVRVAEILHWGDLK